MNRWATLAGVLLPLATGCAAGASAEVSAPKTAAATVTPTRVNDSSIVFRGPTRGKASDPAIASWQDELLSAIGRKDQYSLFEYVMFPNDQEVYVALNMTGLDLTADQIASAKEVQTKYLGSGVSAKTEQAFFAAPMVPPKHIATAVYHPTHE